jgi:hypothetical protein
MKMSSEMEKFPTQKLMFYVTQDIDESVRGVVRELIEKLSTSREWLLGPPTFIDTIDYPENPEVDLPIETVGGVLKIYSALTSIPLPIDLDIKNYHEVVAVVEAVQKISSSENLDFDFELDGNFVGSIGDGDIDKTMQVGLLNAWREHLGI